MTISGDKIDALTNSLTKNSQSIKTIFDGNEHDGIKITFDTNPDNSREYIIDLKETIVQEQTEWKVFIDDFTLRTGLKLLALKECNDESLLPNMQPALARLYVYGIYN